MNLSGRLFTPNKCFVVPRAQQLHKDALGLIQTVKRLERYDRR